MENIEEKQYVYLKIYLNGDINNLPKKSGDYYFGWDMDGTNVINSGIEKLSFNLLDFDPKITDLFDWYFLPCEIYKVSQQSEMLYFFKK